MTTSKPLVLPWQRIVSSGLKHASSYPRIEGGNMTPWEYLMRTWVDSLTLGSVDDMITVYHSQSDWAIACRAIVNYHESERKNPSCTKFQEYECAVSMLQAKKLLKKYRVGR